MSARTSSTFSWKSVIHRPMHGHRGLSAILMLMACLSGGASAASTPPTVSTATAYPAALYGTTTILSALGTDIDDAESALTYTWSAIGTPPGPVTFS